MVAGTKRRKGYWQALTSSDIYVSELFGELDLVIIDRVLPAMRGWLPTILSFKKAG